MPPRPFYWNICCSPERPPTCGLSTYPMIAERAPHAGWTELNAEPSYCHHFIEVSHKIPWTQELRGGREAAPHTSTSWISFWVQPLRPRRTASRSPQRISFYKWQRGRSSCALDPSSFCRDGRR